MKELNCYLLKSELINVEGESQGENPHYILNVSITNRSMSLYLSDNIENLEEDVMLCICNAGLLEEVDEAIININNSEMIINYKKEK